jgi:hypothetical protein
MNPSINQKVDFLPSCSAQVKLNLRQSYPVLDETQLVKASDLVFKYLRRQKVYDLTVYCVPTL